MRSSQSQPIHRFRTLQFLGCILFTVVLASVVFIVPWHPSQAAGDELTVTADADTYIDGNEPNKGYGTSDTMTVKDNPPAVAFVRFTVKGVPQGGPLRSRLRLFITDDSAGAAATLNAFRVPGSWDEGSLTWNTQPSFSEQLGASPSQPFNNGSWAEIDLGNAVTGDGIYSFAITSNTPDRVSFAASSASEAPELVVSLDSPAEPTETFTGEATAEPTGTPTTEATTDPADSGDETFVPGPTDVPEEEETSEPTDIPDETVAPESTEVVEDEDLSEPTDVPDETGIQTTQATY